MFKKHKYSIAILIITILALLFSYVRAEERNLGLSVLIPIQGGTGTNSVPAYGEVLVGTAGGVYTTIATSSLGITGAVAYPDYLSQIGDVSTPSLAAWDVLYYDGANWVRTATTTWDTTGSAGSAEDVWTFPGTDYATPTSTIGIILNASSTISDGLFSMDGGASTTQFTNTGISWLDGLTYFGAGFISSASSTFSSEVHGNDPTVGTHLATKDYVDDSINAILDLFLTDTASDITDLGVNAYLMADVPSGAVESSVASTTLLASTDDQLVFVYAIASSTNPLGTMPTGSIDFHFHAERTAGSGILQVYFELISRDSSQAETIISTSEVSPAISSKASFVIHGTNLTEVELATDDRLLIKVYVNTGVGAGKAITFYQEGTTDVHISIPTLTSALSNIFVRQDGTTPLTANWAAGDFDITGLNLLESDNASTTQATIFAELFDINEDAGSLGQLLSSTGAGVDYIATSTLNVATSDLVGLLDLTSQVTGVLPLTNGGTAKALTASAGGIVWTDAGSMEVLAGTATAGQILRSGSNATPSWSTATFAATYADQDLLYANGANTVAGLTKGSNLDVLYVDGSGNLGWTATSTWDTDTTYLGGDAITLAATTFNFDGGATPGGALGNTWASPTVDSDGTWTEHDNYPADCSTAGQVMIGFGDTTTCVATSTWSNTALALDANPTDCSAGSYALGIDADGTAASCTDATTEINSVVNGLGGTNLTCAAQTCNVDDAFLKLGGDIASAGTYNFGSASVVLEIPQDGTCDATGEMQLWTASSSLQIYDGSKVAVIPSEQEISFTIASTTFRNSSFAKIPFKAPKNALTITDIQCFVVTATDQDIFISDGTNDTETVVCTVAGGEDDGSITNGTFDAREQMFVEMGTAAGDPDWLSVTLTYTIDN